MRKYLRNAIASSPISQLPTPLSVPFVIIICLLRPDRPDEAVAARGANYIWAEFTCTHSALQKSAYIRTVRAALALRTASSPSLFLFLSLHCGFFAMRCVLFFRLMQIFSQPFAEAKCDSDFTQKGANNWKEAEEEKREEVRRWPVWLSRD